MRRRTGEPSDPVMKFFTPELYLRFNSSDDREADLADQAWEDSIRAYRASLDLSRGSMPPRVCELAEQLCLHDAELIALRVDKCDPRADPASPPPAATICLKDGETIIHIDYLLWDEVVQRPFRGPWPNSPERVHWLYDEVDVDGEVDDPEMPAPPRYWHRILLSDGRSLAVPFTDAITSRFSPAHPEPALVERAWSGSP
ncbi:hypothetical protein P12x_005555 [Tundrisphaera lichenicola]|uniref:hypothetical protein n=1 Tax=Tundrisphaera lichenicola TaxID=2029860 RepID=UPI003EBD930D